MRCRALTAAALAAGVCASASGQTPTVGAPGAEPLARYVGADACAACHPLQTKVWRAGPHARAGDSAGRRIADPRCASCHATGDAPVGPSPLVGVQCEACHGAGAGYATADIMRDPTLARALGLRELRLPAARDELCLTCHWMTTRLSPFDSEKAWRQIGHGRDGEL